MKPRLSDFRRNVHSQFGEDGVIEKIFALIGEGSRRCIEFGAWDGYYMSNTARLWSECGWSAVLIEADAARTAALRRNVAAHDCRCIAARVGIGPSDSLEAILRGHGIEGPFDLLSIDIDGSDYHVVESLQSLRPRLIVCEFNPTIPPSIDLVGGYGDYFGCSVAALERVAVSKGYRLVALTDANAFFVRAEEFAAFDAYETDRTRIFIDSHLVHVITTFDGEWVLSRRPPFGMATPYAGTLTGEHVRHGVAAMLGKRARSIGRRLRGLVLRAGA